ncbi:UNVERIFIED_CONTAM: hypothetical protein HDU68_001172 [Siphonaria sp. JEL0065]|nr:hypothetical protein HDU68_001172 [Siphonaria sp. JEL0065]
MLACDHQIDLPRKLFLAQLYQTSIVEEEGGAVLHFSNFRFYNIWIQGTIIQICPTFLVLDDASSPSSLNPELPPTAGLIRVDLDPEIIRIHPFLILGAEIAVIGRVWYDVEHDMFAVHNRNGDLRILDKSKDANAGSRWSLDVCRVHEEVYCPTVV